MYAHTDKKKKCNGNSSHSKSDNSMFDTPLPKQLYWWTIMRWQVNSCWLSNTMRQNRHSNNTSIFSTFTAVVSSDTWCFSLEWLIKSAGLRYPHLHKGHLNSFKIICSSKVWQMVRWCTVTWQTNSFWCSNTTWHHGHSNSISICSTPALLVSGE